MDDKAGVEGGGGSCLEKAWEVGGPWVSITPYDVHHSYLLHYEYFGRLNLTLLTYNASSDALPS